MDEKQLKRAKKDAIVLYESWYGSVFTKNVVLVLEQERWADDFKDPTKFFVICALGDAFYFKTRSREKATSLSDEIFGKGKYTVRQVVKISGR